MAFLSCINGTTGTIIFSKHIEDCNFNDQIDVQGGIIYLFNGIDNSFGNTHYQTYGYEHFKDLELLKLNANTGEKLSSVFLYTPTDGEVASKMAVINGEVYLLGNTVPYVDLQGDDARVLPSGFPITNGVTSYNGESVMTITKINSDNKICFSTYLGGDKTSKGLNISAYNDHIYVFGNNYNPNANGSIDNTYPVTTNIINNQYSNFVWTKFNLNPQMPQGIDSLLPATQSACKNGFANLISGQEIFVPSSLMPTIYTNGVASLQNPIPLKYQWQKSDNATGPWNNIAGANDLNYFPQQLGVVNQYYRRQAYASICAPSNILSTSSVSAVLVNANTAPLITANAVLNNCPSNVIQLGGTPTAVALGGHLLQVIYGSQHQNHLHPMLQWRILLLTQQFLKYIHCKYWITMVVNKYGINQ